MWSAEISTSAHPSGHNAPMRKKLRVLYNCSNCPAWCCTYPRVEVNNPDIERLAAFFGLSRTATIKRHLRKDSESGRFLLKQRRDEHFDHACKFLDKTTRMCKVYEARPLACRRYPGTARCGYYDFLMAERDRQRDDSLIATTDHRP